MKYVKKPIPVEAYPWDGKIPFSPAEGFAPKIYQSLPGLFGDILNELVTEEGLMKIADGSYIVKGPAGEYWAVRKDIFENTYEQVK